MGESLKYSDRSHVRVATSLCVSPKNRRQYVLVETEHAKSWITRPEHIETEWGLKATVNWAIIGSDNGFLPGRRKAIIWSKAELLLIGPEEQTSPKFDVHIY